MGRVRGFLKSHLRLVAGSAVVGLGVSAALAVATVPDGATFKLANATISSDQLSLGLNPPLETLTLIAVAKKGT